MIQPDRLFHLERIGDGVRVETHEPVGLLRRGIGGGAALPEHCSDAELGKGRHLLGPEVVARDGVDHLAAVQVTVRKQQRDRLACRAGLAETHVHRQRHARRESLTCDDVEIERVARAGIVLCRFAGRLHVRPVAGNRGHELRNGLCETGPGGIGCERGRRIGWWRRRDLRSPGDKRRDGVWPCCAEQIVGIARSFRHGDACIDSKRGLVRCVDAGVRVAVGLHVVIGDNNEIGMVEPGVQRLRDWQQVARIHGSDDAVPRGHVQAGTCGPALADQDRGNGLGKRCGLRAHHREMPPLRAARQKTLGPVRGDGLKAVQMPVDILQRDDEVAARIHAQRERAGLLGGKIRMVVRDRACAVPDPGSADGRRVCGRDRRAAVRGRTGSPWGWRRPVGRCAP